MKDRRVAVWAISVVTGKKSYACSIVRAAERFGISCGAIQNSMNRGVPSHGYWFRRVDMPDAWQPMKIEGSHYRSLRLIPVAGGKHIICRGGREAARICGKHLNSVRWALSSGFPCNGYFIRYADRPLFGQPEMRVRSIQVQANGVVYKNIRQCAMALGVKWITVKRHMESGEPLKGTKIKKFSRTVERAQEYATKVLTNPNRESDYGTVTVHSGSGHQLHPEHVAA